MTAEPGTPPDAPEATAPLKGGTLDQLMPVALFFVLFNLVNIEAAVVAATAWSLKAAYARRRRGLPIGAWLPAITAYLVARAAVTIAVQRDLVDFGVSPEAVYFGIGIATKILIGAAVAGTIVAGRPLLKWLIPRFVHLDDAVREHRVFHDTMVTATWMIVVYELASSVWDIWLFNNSGFNVFFLTRSLANFVVSFIAITLGLMYVDRRLTGLDGYPGLVEVLESSGRLRS
ncbi:MAG: hypothetical protein D6683_09740 [Actinomyces sp.]|nr:MAG: hypothetical protein D6683_09740 [Actinomyces sp.]